MEVIGDDHAVSVPDDLADKGVNDELPHLDVVRILKYLR